MIDRFRVDTPWIVPTRKHAADFYPYGHPKWRPITGTVTHFTASRSFEGTNKFLTEGDGNYVSAHFNIDRDGTIVQMVSLDDRAWHAGGRSSRFLGSGNVNGRTIGIELMNLGPLKMADKGLVDAYDRPFKGAFAESFSHRNHVYWEAFSERQIESWVHVQRVLAEIFPVLGAEPTTRHVGHEAVDPARKIDPGPVFPWTYAMRRVFGDDVFKC